MIIPFRIAYCIAGRWFVRWVWVTHFDAARTIKQFRNYCKQVGVVPSRIRAISCEDQDIYGMTDNMLRLYQCHYAGVVQA